MTKKPTSADSLANTTAGGDQATQSALDEYHGKGGEYEMIDGKRVLVSRTDHVPATASVEGQAPAANTTEKV